MEPDPQRERDDPGQRAAEQAWSPYDELAAREDAKWRRSRRRRSLGWFGVALLVICVVGSVGGYVWYDRATRVDRSTPVVVVFQFVNTVFDERDLGRAQLFECESRNASKSLGALLATLEDVERKFEVVVTVSPTDFSTDVRGPNAVVGVSLLIDVPEADGDPSRSRQRWIFELQDQEGWRVREARRE